MTRVTSRVCTWRAMFLRCTPDGLFVLCGRTMEFPPHPISVHLSVCLAVCYFFLSLVIEDFPVFNAANSPAFFLLLFFTFCISSRQTTRHVRFHYVFSNRISDFLFILCWFIRPLDRISQRSITPNSLYPVAAVSEPSEMLLSINYQSPVTKTLRRVDVAYAS